MIKHCFALQSSQMWGVENIAFTPLRFQKSQLYFTSKENELLQYVNEGNQIQALKYRKWLNGQNDKESINECICNFPSLDVSFN